MSLLLSTRRAIVLGVESYMDKVLSTGPIAYWPLDETASGVARCLVNPAQNGTAVGVTWASDTAGPFGTAAPFFDGANDYVNIYSATFAAAFNGAVGSLMIWGKVANAGVWTDASNVSWATLRADSGNQYYFQKNAVNNRFNCVGYAGAGQCVENKDGLSTTDWCCVLMTWSDSNNDDEFQGFWNGVQIAAACASLNAWAGGLDNQRTIIGAGGTAPLSPAHAWLAHCAIWDRVLAQPEITLLANP